MTPIPNGTPSAAVETGLDLVLALLYAPGAAGEELEPVRGISRLQKLLFLLWKEGAFYEDIPNLYNFRAYDYGPCEDIPNLYNFRAYDFGPCMDDLYDDLDFAEDIGLLRVEEVPSGNEYEGADEVSFLQDFGFRWTPKATRRDFALTLTGREAASDIYGALDDDRRHPLCQAD